MEVKILTEKVEGNQSIFMGDENSVWLISKGQVEVFMVAVDPAQVLGNQVKGRRRHLFTAKRGDLLFGINPIENKEYALFFIGTQGTLIRTIKRQALFEENKQEPELGSGEELNKAINRWIELMCQAIADDQISQKALLLEAEVIKRNMLDSDKLLYSQTMESLLCFQQTVFQQMVKEHKEIEDYEAKRFKVKTNSDQVLFQDALTNLSNIMDKKKTKIDALEELTRLTKDSGMRSRKVALRGKWWKKDNGPLLAYMEKDNEPVALIPVSPRKYKLKNFTNEYSVMIDKTIAQEIKPFAYTFYRSFPNKKLGIWDIVLDIFKPVWKRDVMIVLLMGMLGGILALLFPFATGLIFDEIIPEAQESQLIYIGLFLVVGAISQFLFQFIQYVAMARIEITMDDHMQASVWDRVLGLPVSFFREFSVGELGVKIINLGAIRPMLSGMALNSVFSAVFAIPSVLLLFYYDPKLAFKAMFLTSLTVGVTYVFARLKIKHNQQETEVGNKLSGLVFQIIGGIRKFRSSGSERRAFALWAQEFTKLRRITYRSETLSNGFSVFYNVFPLVASIAIFYWVSKDRSGISVGNFIAFNATFTSVVISVLALTNALMTVSDVIPIYKSASPILQALPEYNPVNRDPGELSGDVHIEHVSFKYGPNAPMILDDISLHIHPGEFVAIVGQSGSGKSTLLRILLGFEKPIIGKIYYDSQDLEEIDIRKVRKQLGVVLQNSSLMSGDIYTNIVGAHSHLTMDDAWEAARQSGMEEDIRKMPMGMQTIIAEEGSTLSGGQRQRLSIASAMVNKPRILYFDEATSALDNETQAIVTQSLEVLNVTKVVIAHRLSTIINCDRIIVLDQGKIAEQGTYSELVKNEGLFADMVQRQLV